MQYSIPERLGLTPEAEHALQESGELSFMILEVTTLALQLHHIEEVLGDDGHDARTEGIFVQFRIGKEVIGIRQEAPRNNC